MQRTRRRFLARSDDNRTDGADRTPLAYRVDVVPPPEVPLSTPEPFGSDLLLGDRLGSGATGEVRRATVRSSGEQVAVKLLRPDLASDPVLVARFLQEADVLRRLTHPHLVRLRDVVLEGGRLGLVVDLVDGGDLRRRLQEAGRLTPADAAAVVAQVAAALTAVHAAGVTHRDVKPANVLLDADGSARLADLGIARLASAPELTRHTGVVGTPDYLAPEAGEGRAGPASDVYALGVVLHELLAGQVPFRAAHPVAVLRLHLEAAPPVLPVPEPLAALLAEALAKDPAARPTAEQVERRLRELLPSLAGVPALTAAPATAVLPESASATTHVRARPAATPAPAPAGAAPSRRRPLLLGAAAGVTALALLGAAAAFALRDDGPTDVDLAVTSADASPSASASAGPAADPTGVPTDPAVPVGPVEGLPPAGAPVGDAGAQPAGEASTLAEGESPTAVPPAGSSTAGQAPGSAPAPAPQQTTTAPAPAPPPSSAPPAQPAPAQTTQAAPAPPPPPTQPAAIPGNDPDVRDRRCSTPSRKGINGATVETASCIGFITSSDGRRLVQADTYAREVPGETHNRYGQFRVWVKLHAADGTLIKEKICDLTADFDQPTSDPYRGRCTLSADTAGAGRYSIGFVRANSPALQTDPGNVSRSPALGG